METASAKFARWRKADWTKGDGTFMVEKAAWKELSDLDAQMEVEYVSLVSNLTIQPQECYSQSAINVMFCSSAVPTENAKHGSDFRILMSIRST